MLFRSPLLKEANFNLLIVSAKYGWTSQDDLLLHNLEEQLGSKPSLCLIDAPKYDIQNYAGILPPFTTYRKVQYRLSQLSLSEMFNQWKDYLTSEKKYRIRKKNKAVNDDD